MCHSSTVAEDFAPIGGAEPIVETSVAPLWICPSHIRCRGMSRAGSQLQMKSPDTQKFIFTSDYQGSNPRPCSCQVEMSLLCQIEMSIWNGITDDEQLRASTDRSVSEVLAGRRYAASAAVRSLGVFCRCQGRHALALQQLERIRSECAPSSPKMASTLC